MLNKEKITYKPSFQTDQEIMTVLALEKDYAQYDIPKRIGKNYRTVLRHLSDLKRNHMIRLSKTEMSKKRGKDRNIFTLTELGLLCVLGYSNLWCDIDKVASNYSDALPLIFGKWDFYIKKGLRDKIISRLQAAVQGFFMQFGREWYRIVKANPDRAMKIKLEKLKGHEVAERIMTHHRAIAPTLTHRVLGLAPYLYLGEGLDAMLAEQSFIQILIEDSDLRQYFDEEFEYWPKQAKLEHDRYVQALNWYKEIKAQIAKV